MQQYYLPVCTCHNCTVSVNLGTPNKPNNITLRHRTYNRTASNVTMTWNSPQERVDTYCINVSYGQNQQPVKYTSNASKVVLEGIPYNEQIFVNITSANCHSESDRAHFNFTISKIIIQMSCSEIIQCHA